MSTFKYADEKIRDRDIMIAVPSMVVAVGILTFPRNLAQVTTSSDGWIAIMLSGIFTVIFTWAIVKIAAKFPEQSFLSYASSLVSRPVAVILTLLFSIQGIALTAFEVRAVTDIAHQYLFQATPIEIVSLTFLLVVIYAVSGSRAGIFRLNSMFLPIIFITTVILVFFSIGYMEGKNILPVLQTDVQGYVQGTLQSTLSYTGVGVLFFYISLVRQPKKAPRMAVYGMTWVVMMYILIYFTCIAVFGQTATGVIRFPLVELAKSVEIPGGFFERLESIFFVIWIMAIFTTTAMAFDATVLALNSIFPNVKKIKIILCLAPFIYLISSFPSDYLQMDSFGNFVSYYGWGLSMMVVILLWIMYKIKGAKQRGK